MKIDKYMKLTNPLEKAPETPDTITPETMDELKQMEQSYLNKKTVKKNDAVTPANIDELKEMEQLYLNKNGKRQTNTT